MELSEIVFWEDVLFILNGFLFKIISYRVLLFVAGVMASRLLRGVGSLAAQALRVCSPNGVAAVCSMASGGGVPTDDEQATGLEREVMMAARKGLVRNSFLCLLWSSWSWMGSEQYPLW